MPINPSLGVSSFKETQVQGPWGTSLGDASVAKAIEAVEARGGGAVTGKDMLELMQAGADYGQMTTQEWKQIKDYATKNFGSLSPEAQKMFTEMDRAVQANALPFGVGSVALAGPELQRMMAEMEGLSHTEGPRRRNPPAPPQGPPPPLTDGCDPVPPGGGANVETRPPRDGLDTGPPPTDGGTGRRALDTLRDLDQARSELASKVRERLRSLFG